MPFGWSIKKDPLALKPRTARVLSLLVLVGYPLGLVINHWVQTGALETAGDLLILAALLSFLVLTVSRADRLFEVVGELDEYERLCRIKALKYSFQLIVFLLLLAWLAAGFADARIELSDNAVESLLLALFFWVQVLPIAIQAWWLREPFSREEAIDGEEAR